MKSKLPIYSGLDFCSELSIRKTEDVSLRWGEGMNPIDSGNYFKHLQAAPDKNQLLNKLGSIYNVDETDHSTKPSTRPWLSRKGSENIIEKRKTISRIACCNAEGVIVPSICVLKGEHFKSE